MAVVPAITSAGESSSHQTHRWRRQSRANSSLNGISLVTGKNTGNFAPIPTRAVVKASQTKVLRPKFPGEETGNFSKAEQRIDLPHQGKLLRDQRKERPTEERER